MSKTPKRPAGYRNRQLYSAIIELLYVTSIPLLVFASSATWSLFEESIGWQSSILLMEAAAAAVAIVVVAIGAIGFAAKEWQSRESASAAHQLQSHASVAASEWVTTSIASVLMLTVCWATGQYGLFFLCAASSLSSLQLPAFESFGGFLPQIAVVDLLMYWLARQHVQVGDIIGLVLVQCALLVKHCIRRNTAPKESTSQSQTNGSMSSNRCEFIIVWQLIGCTASLSFNSFFSKIASPSYPFIVSLAAGAQNLLHYLVSDPVHWALATYWLLCLSAMAFLTQAISIRTETANRIPGPKSTARISLSAGAMAIQVERILMRKFFHVMVLLMFIPGTILRPRFMAIAYAVALSLFILMEFVRLGLLHLAPATSPTLRQYGQAIDTALRVFTDERDSGLLIETHIYLLVGCALPLWIELWANNHRLKLNLFTCLLGVLVLGVGDTVASAIGTRLGRHRIHRFTEKTVEGTLASIIAVTVSWLIVSQFIAGGMGESISGQWDSRFDVRVVATIVATCVYEALTNHIDNLVVPLFGTGVQTIIFTRLNIH